MNPIKAMSSLVASLAIALISPHALAGLSYETVDVPDTMVGVDRMKYVYHLDGAFTQFYGFNLIYDPAQYAALDITVPLGSDWAPSITQPDALAPLTGLVSHAALIDITDATATFEVEFDWLGTGIPGSQPYEIFDDFFNVVTTARTTPFGATPPDPTVPEPGTLTLAAAALLALSSQRLRRRVPAPSPITHA